MKIRPVGAESFHTDGYADRHDESTVEFRNFAQAPKIVSIIKVLSYLL
jgi:hypothetical protein